MIPFARAIDQPHPDQLLPFFFLILPIAFTTAAVVVANQSMIYLSQCWLLKIEMRGEKKIKIP